MSVSGVFNTAEVSETQRQTTRGHSRTWFFTSELAAEEIESSPIPADSYFDTIEVADHFEVDEFETVLLNPMGPRNHQEQVHLRRRR